jgi:hypothetical protein
MQLAKGGCMRSLPMHRVEQSRARRRRVERLEYRGACPRDEALWEATRRESLLVCA